jgi:hypothetical protein
MMEALQVSMPTNETNAWVWIAGVLVVALGALFLRYDGGQNKRAERCEKREDLVLADNRSQAETIKEQSTTLLRVAGLAENTVEGIKVTHQKVDSVIRLLEERPTTTRRQS